MILQTLENRDLKQLRLFLPSRQRTTTANPQPAEHIHTKRNRHWQINSVSTTGCPEDYVGASFFLAFQQPADAVDLQLPGYHTIVRSPVDLSAIKRRFRKYSKKTSIRRSQIVIYTTSQKKTVFL